MYDIFYIGNHDLKERFPTAKRVDSFEQAQQQSLTKMFWIVWDDIILAHDFNFTYKPDEWSQEFIHTFLNGDTYDGIILVPKGAEITERELHHRFFINKKEVDVVASTPKPFDLYYVDTWEDYEHALENSSTEMFWAVSHNLKYNMSYINNFYFSHHNSYDRKENHAFVHEVNGKKLYNGVFLCSRNKPLNKKEIEYRFLVNAKQWDDVVSGPRQYDIFTIDTYEDYRYALKNSSTEMFWLVPSHVQTKDNFKFDLYFSHDNKYDRNINHVFLNGKYHDGIILCSKIAEISKKEFDYKFLTNKKEVDTIASTPKPYDIVFISYNEPNADANYAALQQRFPRAKRIHGVKGIHQAHIAAAELCDTDMFWIVDGDAQIADGFNFDFQSPKWQRDNVYVWRSINPINDLVYGYGGIKLFPRKETLNMDTSKPDMTTSISSKFNAMPQISNITAFNTDPFNTWKSAFRECAKLSSKVIDRQKEDETNARLETWTTVGHDRNFGEYAIRGARAGMEFGLSRRDNLGLINDFDWLEEKFNEQY